MFFELTISLQAQLWNFNMQPEKGLVYTKPEYKSTVKLYKNNEFVLPLQWITLTLDKIIFGYWEPLFVSFSACIYPDNLGGSELSTLDHKYDTFW